MTAADRREELEAAIWHAMRSSGTCRATGPCPGCNSNVDDILAAADTYAEAVADDRITGRVTERATGRQRLAEAAAEVARGTTP